MDVVRLEEVYLGKTLVLFPYVDFDHGTAVRPGPRPDNNAYQPISAVMLSASDTLNKVAGVYSVPSSFQSMAHFPIPYADRISDYVYMPVFTEYSYRPHFRKDNYVKTTVELITEIEGQRDTTVYTKTFVPKINYASHHQAALSFVGNAYGFLRTN